MLWFCVQDRSKARFVLGDGCKLDPQQLGQFGCVFAGNVLYMMQEPRQFLRSVADVIVPGGVLVLSACYTWGEHFSPKVRLNLSRNSAP